MPDPTAEFAAKLNDPTQWVIKRAVPIFEPHTTQFAEVKDPATGKVLRSARTVTVTEADLETICNEMACDEACGQYGTITPGHKDPLKPETEAPPLFGFHRNPRIIPTGPDQKKRLVVDEYLFPDKAKERGQYPYRSADYFPAVNNIFGVAVLKRKPRLNLGTFAYQCAERGECYQYAMGPMNATTPEQGMGTPPAAQGAEASPPPETDEEKKLFEKFRVYLVRTYGLDPDWPKCDTKEMGDKDQGMGGDPNKPTDTGDKGEVTPMADDAKVLQYQAEVAQYKAEVEALKTADAKRAAELEGMRLERDQERCTTLMYQLTEVEQYQLTDEQKATELKKLVAIPHAERAERLKELRLIYAGKKVPGSDKIEQYRGHVEGGDSADPHKAPSYHEAAMQYMRDHIGCQYETAVAKVKEQAPKL